MKTAFDYGEYEKLAKDPRTKTIYRTLAFAARAARVEYEIVGGLAAYLYVKNPPGDYPDIDILVHGSLAKARMFVRALAWCRGFHVGLLEADEHGLFASLDYDGDIQVDIFTSADERPAKVQRRIKGLPVKGVESLVAEKLIRGTASDVRSALDLLAYVEYDKRTLAALGRKYKMTGMLQHLAYWARRLAAGRLSKAGVDAIVRRATTTGE